jgi:hypothetical protein
MIDKSKMEQQREADRRLALLALVSEQPEPCGACLEPEELSALIEGRLTPEQIEPCLTHLAGCERCYALWLRLDREWRGQTGRSNRNTLRRLISRPRVLAAAGSLLAAAASIAVFLNITVDHRVLPRLPEKAAQEQALSMPALKTTAQVAPEQEAPATPAASSLQSADEQAENLAINPEDKPADREIVAPRADDAKHRSGSTAFQPLDQTLDAAEPAQPKATTPAITAQHEKKAEQSPATAPIRITPITPRTPRTPVAPAGEAPNQVAPLIADQQAVQSEETAATLAGEAVPSSAPQPALRAAAAPPAAEKAEATPLTYAAWQTALRQGCQGQPGSHFFETIRNEGTQLLRQSATLPKQERRRIERVLALIGGSQTPAQQCRAMLDLLGPEAPNPRP